MEARVPRHLGVEGGPDHGPLANRRDPPVVEPGQNLDSAPDLLDNRRSDENRVKWLLAKNGDEQIFLEAIDLTAKGVSPHAHIEPFESWQLGAIDTIGEDNHSRTGAQNRKSLRNSLAKDRQQLVLIEQETNGAAFATRNDESIQSGQIGRRPYFNSLDTSIVKRSAVLAKIALESEDSDAHGTTSHA